MLTFAGQIVIGKFMEWLNKKELSPNNPCEVIFLPTHSSVEWEGEFGFAAYVPSQEIIYVAGDLYSVCKNEKITVPEAERIILENLAHEYAHHLQSVSKRTFDETEAESAVWVWIREYLVAESEGNNENQKEAILKHIFPYENSDEAKKLMKEFSELGAETEGQQCK